MKKKKGQAAIEFLTTYSWALLIIFMTVGVLIYFDLFNTTRYLSETCETGAQISCAEGMVTEGGVVSLRLVNNHPVNINITNVQVELGSDQWDEDFSEVLDRGADEIYDVGTGQPFSSSSRETFNLLITFKREGGSKTYEVRGRLVARPLP